MAALTGDIFSKIILFHIRFITVCLCTSAAVFSFVDLHRLASSHSGNIRALLQEREYAEVPRALQNLPECHGL